MRKILIFLYSLLFVTLLAPGLFQASAKTITIDTNFDDWDDVDIFVEDAVTDYPYSGTIYYFNTTTHAWQTEEIADSCMYTQNRAIDLGELKLTNDDDKFYVLWGRGSNFFNYYWRIGDATEEGSFDDDPATADNSNPCVGEVVTSPAAFDHDLVVSFDIDNDGSYEYYFVVNVTFDEEEYETLYALGYIYEDSGNGIYSSGEEILVTVLHDDEYQISGMDSDGGDLILQEASIGMDEILNNMDISWGDTVTIKYEAHSEAIDTSDTAEYTFSQTDSSSGTNTFSEDSNCRWIKPPETTWIQFKNQVKDDVSGVYLTWVQYDADKVDIMIDDGSGSFPWVLSKTSNDGHEFLPNVAPWQQIKIRPHNHCKSGDTGTAVSATMYPYGWYNAF